MLDMTPSLQISAIYHYSDDLVCEPAKAEISNILGLSEPDADLEARLQALTAIARPITPGA